MASYAEIANDLEAHARRFYRTHDHDAALSFRRGAQAIRTLISRVAELEVATEAEARKRERYMDGEDVSR